MVYYPDLGLLARGLHPYPPFLLSESFAFAYQTRIQGSVLLTLLLVELYRLGTPKSSGGDHLHTLCLAFQRTLIAFAIA